MRNKLLAAAVAALLIGGVGDVAIATSARASTTVVYNHHLTNEQWVFTDGTTDFHPHGPPSPGDRNFLRFEISQNGNVVGYANVTCTFIFNGNSQCIGVDAITGRGDLILAGLVRPNGEAPPAVFDLAITGGTFAFSGARGDVHIENSPPGQETVTVHFE